MSKQRGFRPKHSGKGGGVDGRARREVSLPELKAILAKARSALNDEDFTKLNAAVDTLAELTAELEAKGVSVERLKRLLFGASTEKTRNVVGTQDRGESAPANKTESKPETNGKTEDEGKDEAKNEGNAAEATDATVATTTAAATTSMEPKAGSTADDVAADSCRPGHGRNGAESYTGAERVFVAHAQHKAGDVCGLCTRGKLYRYEASPLVRVTGVAPIRAKIWELERLRCNACGAIFTASAPADVGTQKYDERAAAMIAMLRYGTGVPFFRLERLEASLGIPLPDSTQWHVVEPAAAEIMPVFVELTRQAAQGCVLHNDDTPVQILEIFKMMKDAAAKEDADAAGKPGKERTGKYTTGVVSVKDDRKAVLFFSGRQHAGENLRDVLAERAAELPPPIHMSDALSANIPKGRQTISGSCNTHARRNFVEIADDFPEEVRYVLDNLREVYANDATTRREGMSDQARLEYHQAKSQPVMNRLLAWIDQQMANRVVEPNSTLGKAMKYMQRHWEKLTIFLREPGAPLDNNICERALKRAILHRKNSLFYKTLNGARVGDAFMSLIHTAELAGTNPFEYLVAMLQHPADVEESPEDWLPWNYRTTLADLNAVIGDAPSP